MDLTKNGQCTHKLNFIATEEGRVVWPKDGTPYPEYFLKDHLGNVRVRIADKNYDNLVHIDPNNPEEDELMNVRHYYPSFKLGVLSEN